MRRSLFVIIDIVLLLIIAFLASIAVSARQNIRNPRAVSFQCPDHAQDDQHQVDIVSSSGTVIQTILGGDPPADGSGVVTIPLNVQPIAFGTNYTVRVRAVAGSAVSDSGVSDNVFDRVPGAPSRVTIGGQ